MRLESWLITSNVSICKLITTQHSGSDYFSTSQSHGSWNGLISKSCNSIYCKWPSEIKITYPLRASISSFQSKTNNLWGRNFQQGQRPLSRIQGYGIEDEWEGHNRPPEPCAARTRPLVQRFIRQIMAISEIPRVNFVGQLSVGRRDQGVVYVDPKTSVLRSVASFRLYSQN